MDTDKTPLQKAVDLAGGQTALANLIDDKQSNIWWWLNKTDGKVPPDVAKKIDAALNGKITRAELCPEIFGDEANQ